MLGVGFSLLTRLTDFHSLLLITIVKALQRRCSIAVALGRTSLHIDILLFILKILVVGEAADEILHALSVYFPNDDVNTHCQIHRSRQDWP